MGYGPVPILALESLVIRDIRSLSWNTQWSKEWRETSLLDDPIERWRRCLNPERKAVLLSHWSWIPRASSAKMAADRTQFATSLSWRNKSLGQLRSHVHGHIWQKAFDSLWWWCGQRSSLLFSKDVNVRHYPHCAVSSLKSSNVAYRAKQLFALLCSFKGCLLLFGLSEWHFIQNVNHCAKSLLVLTCRS